MPRPDAHMDPNRGHIDPGNPPASRYPDDLNCHSVSAVFEQQSNPSNPDPINRPGPWQGTKGQEPKRDQNWQPGPPSWDADAEAEQADKYRVRTELPLNGIGDTEFYPTARPDRDGPDYINGEEEDDLMVFVGLHLPVSAITPRIQDMLQRPVADALRAFVRSNLQYGDTDEDLGVQGQFSEIYHITRKLKRMVWDRRNPQSVTVGEVEEALVDLIGHAILAMSLNRKGNKDGRQA